MMKTFLVSWTERHETLVDAETMMDAEQEVLYGTFNLDKKMPEVKVRNFRATEVKK